MRSLREPLFSLKQVESVTKLVKLKVKFRSDKWLDESEVGLKVFIFISPAKSKGGSCPPFLDQPPLSKIPPFLEIEDVPTIHRSIGKAKVLNNSCNQFVYNFYPQSILILEECLQKW